jgi:hypothetical protein
LYSKAFSDDNEILIYIILRVAKIMNAERILLTMIVALAATVTLTFLTSSVLAQTDTGTQDTTDGGTTDGGTTDGGTTDGGTTDGGTTTDDESSLYREFQSCLESAAGGQTGFATEDEIRECFIDAGYTGAGDDQDDDGGDDQDDDGGDDQDDDGGDDQDDDGGDDQDN